MRALILWPDGRCDELDTSGRFRGEDGMYEAMSIPEEPCVNLEALPIFPPRPGRSDATLYIDGEGRDRRPVNALATLWLQEHNLLFPGDYVSGPLLAIGFDPGRGEHRPLPAEIEVLPWPRPQGARPFRP